MTLEEEMDILRAQSPELMSEVRRIREVVFIREQSVPEDREYDEFEDVSVHFLAISKGKGIGCIRFRTYGSDVKMERLAVLGPFRGKGVGMALMKHAESEAAALEPERFILHSQISAIGFYEKCGYVAVGPVFQDAFIDHREMIKEVR